MKSLQELNSLALKTRRIWGEDGYSPIDIFALINGWKEKKITIIKHPLTPRISGMCTKEGEDIAICINSATSFGRQRFTLAHELYHVLYEDNMRRVICDMNVSENESEKEADQFASYLLLPYDALLQYKEDLPWSLEKIIDAEQFFQVSHQALINRLFQDGLITSKEADEYRNIKISFEASKLGYSKNLYFPDNKDRQYITTGEYIRKVEKLVAAGIISNGKREELLLDAYREDIVYDLDEGENYLND